MPHPPQQKNHLSAQPNTPNNRKDASITPSSRFLSFPQVSNHSSHSPSPQKISPLVTSTTNQVQCLRDFERFGFGEQNRGVFWGKIHIKSVIFSIKFAENYSSLPLTVSDEYIHLHHDYLMTSSAILFGVPAGTTGCWHLSNFTYFQPATCQWTPCFFGGVFLPISRPGNTGPPPPILSSWLTHNPWWMKIQEVESA